MRSKPSFLIVVLVILSNVQILYSQPYWSWGGDAIGSSTTDYIGTNNAKDFDIWTSFLRRISVNANGNVSIGNLTPRNRLHIDENSAGASYGQFTNITTGNSSRTDGFLVGVDANGNAILNSSYQSSTDGNMNFYTAGTQRMTIIGTSTSNEGNVGIGISTSPSPFSKLHIQSGTYIDPAATFAASTVKELLDLAPMGGGPYSITGTDVGLVATSHSGSRQNIGSYSISQEDSAVFNIGSQGFAKGNYASLNIGVYGEAQGMWPGGEPGSEQLTTNIGVLGHIKGQGQAICGMVIISDGSTLIDEVQGVKSNITAVNGSTIHRAAVFKAEFNNHDAWPTAGRIDSAFGLYIEPVLADSFRYGIWQQGANDLNFFRGKVGVGIEKPAYALDVNGTVNASQILITTNNETQDLLALITQLQNEVRELKEQQCITANGN